VKLLLFNFITPVILVKVLISKVDKSLFSTSKLFMLLLFIDVEKTIEFNELLFLTLKLELILLSKGVKSKDVIELLLDNLINPCFQLKYYLHLLLLLKKFLY